MNDKNLYYKDKEGSIEYNPLCVKCTYKCKQSFRSQILSCRLIKENKKRGKNNE